MSKNGNDIFGYHTCPIVRGSYGELDKITEEYHEVLDAAKQHNPVMVLTELSDLIGAIDGYTLKYHNIGIMELVTMARATGRAFQSGQRSPRHATDPDCTCRNCGLQHRSP